MSKASPNQGARRMQSVSLRRSSDCRQRSASQPCARSPPSARSRFLTVAASVRGRVETVLRGRGGRRAHRSPLLLPGVIQQRAVGARRFSPPFRALVVHFCSIWPSVGALRWLSVACALGAVACGYALGRELTGDLAGPLAAWIVATSALLHVYGTFGRVSFAARTRRVGGLNMLLLVWALDPPKRACASRLPRPSA